MDCFWMKRKNNILDFGFFFWKGTDQLYPNSSKTRPKEPIGQTGGGITVWPPPIWRNAWLLQWGLHLISITDFKIPVVKRSAKLYENQWNGKGIDCASQNTFCNIFQLHFTLGKCSDSLYFEDFGQKKHDMNWNETKIQQIHVRFLKIHIRFPKFRSRPETSQNLSPQLFLNQKLWWFKPTIWGAPKNGGWAAVWPCPLNG